MSDLQIESVRFDDDVVRNVLLAVDRIFERETYAELTVKQICEEAGISKATFYRHFGNAREPIDWYMKRSMKVSIGNIGRTLTWNEGIRAGLACAYRMRFMVGSLGGADPRSRLKHDEVFDECCFTVLAQTLVICKRVALTERLEYLVRSWSSTFQHGIDCWFSGGNTIPLETMASWLEATVPHELYELLEEPSDMAEQTSEH
jgi:AcrR family transcriptional regulator